MNMVNSVDIIKFFFGNIFAVIMLAAGRELYRNRKILNMKLSSAVMFTPGAFVLSFIEAECIRRNFITIFGWTPAFFLLIIGLQFHVKYSTTSSRKTVRLNFSYNLYL